MSLKKRTPLFALRFHGGADEVTGSRHLLTVGGASVMLDCGLFQGHRHEAIQKNETFPAPPEEIHAVLLSHAHIDHSGALPLLVKRGFKGAIHCTPATAALLRIMLTDSARIQEEDAKFFNKLHAEEEIRIEPLYTEEDAQAAIALVHEHPYDERFKAAPHIAARFLNAGHVLGSAMIHIEAKGPKGLRHILFTGDLGRRHSLLMKPPVPPAHTDYLLIESTYGARRHDPVDNADDLFAEVIARAAAAKSLILIPAFALERTQEIVFIIERLRKAGRIPPIHVYVDSPMAIDITDLFVKHGQSVSLAEDFRRAVRTDEDPFGLKRIRYVRTVEESKQLSETPGPKIILAGSGMCEGGRILHHLRNHVGEESTIILLVGYQVKGTLGRSLLDRAKKVRIFGLSHEVRAEIHQLRHFSSHADQDDLLAFVRAMDPRPQRVFLVHGDADQQKGFAAALASAGVNHVVQPEFGSTHELT